MEVAQHVRGRPRRSMNPAESLRRIRRGTRVRIFVIRDGISEALRGIVLGFTDKDVRLRTMTGEHVLVPLALVTSFSIPQEDSLKNEASLRRSRFGRRLVTFLLATVVLVVIGYFVFRRNPFLPGRPSSGETFLPLAIDLAIGGAAGLLVGWIVARFEKSEHRTARDRRTSHHTEVDATLHEYKLRGSPMILLRRLLLTCATLGAVSCATTPSPADPSTRLQQAKAAADHIRADDIRQDVSYLASDAN